MDFMELYAQKKMTAEQAAAQVKSGDWVDYGWAVNTPVAVDAALAKRLPELENVNFRGGILMWVPEIFQIDDPAAHMTWNSWHMGGIERKAIAQGFSFYSPIRYSELPRYYRESPDPLDVAIFQVTPMDEHGYFNFGPSASHLGAVCEKAKKIIVEVNTNMPRCLGGMENCVHISKVSGIVEGSNPPIGQMAAAGPASEVDLKVANLVVPLIPNGACLQLGIGGMPNAIGSLIAQSDLKDLGVHTISPRPARSRVPTSSWTMAVRSTRSVPAPKRCTTTSITTPSACPPPWITPTISAASRLWTTSSPSTTRWISTCLAR